MVAEPFGGTMALDPPMSRSDFPRQSWRCHSLRPTFVEDLGVSLVQQVLQLVVSDVGSRDLQLPLQMVLLPVEGRAKWGTGQ